MYRSFRFIRYRICEWKFLIESTEVKVDFKINGISVDSKDEIPDDIKKIISNNYKRIIDSELKKYQKNDEWNVNFTSLTDMKNHCIMDNIEYKKYSSHSSITFWFNSEGKNKTKEFYEYHSLRITFDIKDGEIDQKSIESSI